MSDGSDLMVIVAAVQIERRPGRPSLTSSTRRQTVSAHTARAMISNNNFTEELGEEKSLAHSSLDQFKATLAKLGPSLPPPQAVSVLDSDPDIFDSLAPALVSFSLKAPGVQGGVTSPSIQLVAETSSRLLFMSTSWATSVPVFRDMTSSLQVRSSSCHHYHLTCTLTRPLC